MKIVVLGTIASSIIGFRGDLIKDLVSKGHKVYAFALDFDEVAIKKVQEFGAIPIQYDFNRAGLNPLEDILNTFKLAKKLKSVSPDLVFSYFSKPVIFGTLAAAIAGVKRRIGMLEGLGYLFTEQPTNTKLKTSLIKNVQVWLYHLSFSFLEKIIFLNPDDPKDLIVRYGIKVKEVNILGGIGLNLEDYPYSPANNVHISFIFIGRLLAEKGINEFLTAAKLVKNKYPKIRFVVLGGVDQENPGKLSIHALKQLANDGLIIYPGHVSNVVEWIIDSSIFVLPSYREGVPRSTQEAMAIGRGIITTDVPGCRETVIDGVNGFLVPPWSSEKLAEKMTYFIENPDCIQKMGMESRKLAELKFDSKIVNNRLLKILNIQS